MSEMKGGMAANTQFSGRDRPSQRINRFEKRQFDCRKEF
jgi:hypothetical protein